MTRKAVSAVIIAKNAANDLPACLDSIRWVDEIVLVDSGSDDETIAIAESYGAKVFQHTDWPGYGPQRQRAQKHASHEWIFMIDVDERVTPELRASIEALLEAPDPDKVYCFDRVSDFFGRLIHSSGWYPDWVERLYHTAHFAYDDAQVHERVRCTESQKARLSGELLHYTTSSYDAFMKKSLRYAQDWSNERYQRGKRTSAPGVFVRSLGTFLVKYLLRRGFTEGTHGLMLAGVSAVYTFHKYAALWVLQQKEQQSKSL